MVDVVKRWSHSNTHGRVIVLKLSEKHTTGEVITVLPRSWATPNNNFAYIYIYIFLNYKNQSLDHV